METLYGQCYYTIIEIKYCKDTDPGPQQERAMQQHQELLDLIEQHDPIGRASIVPLMLGVTGVIYEDTMLALERHLRITGPRLATLARKLHFSAILNLLQIWKQR
jgi:hypothetical protein